MKRLCCSPGTAVALTKDSLEISELTIPMPDPYTHLMAHMDSMGEMAMRVGALSNFRAKVKIYVPDRFVIARAALVLLIIGGIIEVYTSATHYGSNDDAAAIAAQAGGNPTASAAASGLPGADNWRYANAADFDITTAEWMRQHGKTPTGRLAGDFAGQGASMAYALVHQGQDGNSSDWRVALTKQGKPILDAIYSRVLGVMLIPKGALSGVEWVTTENGRTPQSPADGDGIMLIRRDGDANVATIYFLSGGKVQSGIPSDYLRVASR
jgi:hypothetical protein